MFVSAQGQRLPLSYEQTFPLPPTSDVFCCLIPVLRRYADAGYARRINAPQSIKKMNRILAMVGGTRDGKNTLTGQEPRGQVVASVYSQSIKKMHCILAMVGADKDQAGQRAAGERADRR